MGKGMDRKKEDKKKPTKTLEEKRAAKREKKAARGWFLNDAAAPPAAAEIADIRCHLVDAALPCFTRRPGDVRRQQKVGDLAVHERLTGQRRFLGQDIDAGAAEPTCLEGGGKSCSVNQRAARRIDQQCIRLHQRQLAHTDETAGCIVEGAMQ